MNEWRADSTESAEAERIALDSEANGDLDEALKEAVEAVEAAERDREVTTETGSDEARPETDASSAEDEAAVEGGDDGAPTDELGALRRELDEVREKATRTLADFDNYRKRVEREMRAQLRYDGLEVLRGLLDIVDNLERALDSEGEVADLKAGVELTLRQAESLLQRHHVTRIPAAETAFDPTVHEAVARHEEEGVTEPRVTAVLQSGYLMHDRLLRPVRVAVAVPAKGSEPADTEG